MTFRHPTVETNCLLAGLPSPILQRIEPDLSVVPLAMKEYLHGVGRAMTHVYFPTSGFCSVVTVLTDGRMVEVATIGREGAIGSFSATNGERPSTMVVVQSNMEACYRLPFAAFQREFDRHGPFAKMMNAYHHALTGATMQATACNAVHDVEQRLARWLLMAHDRVGERQFMLTQEFVAMMLGVARPTVTLAAQSLQAAGAITYHRGELTIHQRECLERAACECYRLMTDELRAVSEPPCEWADEPAS